MKFLIPLFLVASVFANDIPDAETLLAANETFDFSSITPLQQISTPAPNLQFNEKSPLLAGTLSIVPGLGHAYLGDMKTAGLLFGSAGLGAGTFFALRSSESAQWSSFQFTQTAWFYSMYAAYRDAKKLTCVSYQMPQEQFTDLVYAPFQLSVLKKTEVWGGILGALALAITSDLLTPKKGSLAASSFDTLKPAFALPIAIAEESLFRGFLQSAISDHTNSIGGLTFSSLAFGAAHLVNTVGFDQEEKKQFYIYNLPMLTLLGAYMGWMTQKNVSLKESVAMHMWYDFCMFSISAFSKNKASIGPTVFTVAIPF